MSSFDALHLKWTSCSIRPSPCLPVWLWFTSLSADPVFEPHSWTLSVQTAASSLHSSLFPLLSLFFFWAGSRVSDRYTFSLPQTSCHSCEFWPRPVAVSTWYFIFTLCFCRNPLSSRPRLNLQFLLVSSDWGQQWILLSSVFRSRFFTLALSFDPSKDV